MKIHKYLFFPTDLILSYFKLKLCKTVTYKMHCCQETYFQNTKAQINLRCNGKAAQSCLHIVLLLFFFQGFAIIDNDRISMLCIMSHCVTVINQCQSSVVFLMPSPSHNTFSLVTMRTRTHWSNPEHTHRPCLSGLQSRLAIG